jgi:tetratricopeptide (TPR) repeat protein
MTPFLLLAAALTDISGDAARTAACKSLIARDAPAAVEQAGAWADRDQSVAARQCLGLAFAAVERWAPAQAVFEQAAADAAAAYDPRAPGLWSAAANAALAADQPAKARADLDHALSAPALPPVLAGEAWIDRARANVALDDLGQARIDMDKALALVPQDPFAWLLSATLARRQDDLPRAQKDIMVALKAASDDPAVQLEAGNIAAAGGQLDAARAAWTRAAQMAPTDPAGKTAAALLAQPGVPTK